MKKKRFNVTGLCVPHKHYMVDISGKLAQIKELIEYEHYFTINRARQYGKTTTLLALRCLLEKEFLIASISFEGLGDTCFASDEAFCLTFMEIVQRALRYTPADGEYISKWVNKEANSFKLLGNHITDMCEGKRIILLIDEVDKTSNNRVFLNFLSMLRTKYLAREAGDDYTFHSVVLAGVNDIKNIKLKIMRKEADGSIVREEVKTYNSPWNIAVNFDVDMSFSAPEIATMLRDYEDDHHTGMDVTALSEEIRRFTSGYPFLVSRICQYIDEKSGKNWTIRGVQDAVDEIVGEENTLFDDLFKNMENHKDLYDLIYSVLIVGEVRRFSVNNPAIKLAAMYGIVKERDRHVKVANKIFEVCICDYFVSKDETINGRRMNGVLQQDVVQHGRFDMELCLRKFAEHYKEIYSDNDLKFLERHGRLLFLSYLSPLINGQGFYHIESQFTNLQRMDIVVDFGQQQFIIELKLWRGEAAQGKAYTQLLDYMESKRMDEGYLVTFDFRKGAHKEVKAEWAEIGEGYAKKRIFEVIV